MDIEQELAAIVSFLSENSGENVEYYFSQIPEDFKVPSIFFPVPESTCKKVTFSTVKTELVWRIRFLGVDDTQAYNMAASNQQAIILLGNAIPLYDLQGEAIGRLKVGYPHISKLGVGIVQMEISCERYTGIMTAAQKAEHFEVSGLGYDLVSLNRAYMHVADYIKKEEEEKHGNESGENAESGGENSSEEI